MAGKDSAVTAALPSPSLPEFRRDGAVPPVRLEADLPPQELSAWRSREWIDRFRRRPRIAVVVPVGTADADRLERCVASVRGQHYDGWELLLVPADPDSANAARGWAHRDRRIKCLPPERDRTAATNAGIAAAAGEFVAFLDAGDELAPDALVWIVAALDRCPDALWLYSDEDAIDADGRRSSPHFKPAFSPELLLGTMCCGRLGVYAADLLRTAGGLRDRAGGDPEHDLALRLSDLVPRDRVVHVPRVLYHRRPAAGFAADPGAVAEALARRGAAGRVVPLPGSPPRYRIDLLPRTRPTVSVILATRNGAADVKKCLDSIHAKAGYDAFDVILIDNASDDPAALASFAEEQAAGRLRIVRYPHPFNHSDMHNVVVNDCVSDYVVLMNDDVEVLSDSWLPAMIATAELAPDVAGVGALLLYPDGTVQHAGVVNGLGGVAGHAFKGLAAADPGHHGRAEVIGEYSAATAAMLLLRRSAFVAVGGFDAARYPTSFNDVDLWAKLQHAGYRCLYNPFVRAIHYESKSRRFHVPPETTAGQGMLAQWGRWLARDPFYNPNLSTDVETFDRVRGFPIRAFEEDADQFRRVGLIRPQAAEASELPTLRFPLGRVTDLSPAGRLPIGGECVVRWDGAAEASCVDVDLFEGWRFVELGRRLPNDGCFAFVVPEYAVAGGVLRLTFRDATDAQVGPAAFSPAFDVVYAATPGRAVPLYRLYDPGAMKHHFTADPEEYAALRAAGWVPHGNFGCVFDGPAVRDGVAATPCYRLLHRRTGRRIWTAERCEYFALKASEDWRDEGVDGYVFAAAVAGTTPLFRLARRGDGTHRWTLDRGEYDVLTGPGGDWTGEGIVGHVPTSPDVAAAA